MTNQDSPLENLMGQNVVIDVRGQFVYVGRLTSHSDRFCVLEEADVHDLRDTSTTPASCTFLKPSVTACA